VGVIVGFLLVVVVIRKEANKKINPKDPHSGSTLMNCQLSLKKGTLIKKLLDLV